jgi:hypothetical protein
MGGKNGKIYNKLVPIQNTLPQSFHAVTNTRFRNKNLCPRIKRRKQHFNSKIEGGSKTMNFKELLLESIDDGLSVLGESGKQVVYYHLKENFKIKRQDIPYKIEEFTDAIERIFGAGAQILEIKIMRCLFKKGGYTIKKYSKLPNLTFIEYITTAKLAMNNYTNGKEHKLNTDYKQKRKNTLGRPHKTPNAYHPNASLSKVIL